MSTSHNRLRLQPRKEALSVGFVSNVVINATSKNGKDKLILYQLLQSLLLWQVTEVKDFVIRDESKKKTNKFRSQDSLIRENNRNTCINKVK